LNVGPTIAGKKAQMSDAGLGLVVQAGK